MVAGVCGGIADYVKVDPNVVRLAFALFMLVGAGFLAYFAAWLLMPLAGEEKSIAARWLQR